MGENKGKKSVEQFRGQLMLQIAAGRFFRPGVLICEHPHRRTLHSNAWLPRPIPFALPVGKVLDSTELDDVSTVRLETIDRLEAQDVDGADVFMGATSGDNLVDDVAYVMTFVISRAFSRNYDEVLRLVAPEGRTTRRRGRRAISPTCSRRIRSYNQSKWRS